MATLTPVPKFQAFDANGNPLAGGLLYSYEAGTTTPLATYTDSTGGTPNTNPVVLDARGEASVWLADSPYKLVLKDATDVEIWTVDNVEGAGYYQNLLSSTAEGSGIDLVGNSIKTVADVTAARALTAATTTKALYIRSFDGGMFYRDSADTSSAENGGSYCGTIIRSADYATNGVWKRRWAELDIRWFGGGLGGDDTTPIDNAVAVLSENDVSGCGPGASTIGGGVLRFPGQDTVYSYIGTLVIDFDGLTIRGDGASRSQLSVTGTIQIGTANIDATHGYYDGIAGPSFTRIESIHLVQQSVTANVRLIQAQTANRFYLRDCWLQNSGAATGIAVELISAQWVGVSRCRFQGWGQCSVHFNAAGHGHGHAHISESTFTVTGDDLDGTDAEYRAHILGHSYRGDGSEGTPTNCGGNFFGAWREMSISGCHLYQATAEEFLQFAAIKSRNYLWPNEVNDAGRNQTRSVFVGLTIDDSTWFEGIHTWADFNGQDYVFVNGAQSLSNARTMQGFRMGNGNDSLLAVDNLDVSEFQANAKYDFTSILGGTISPGDYFQDASGNIMIVRNPNATADSSYARTESTWNIIDIGGAGTAVTFYSDAACTIPTGVTATATLVDTCAMVSTNNKFNVGAIHADGANITKWSFVDFTRWDISLGKMLFDVYGSGLLTLTHNQQVELTAANTDSTYAATWPYNTTPRMYSATPRSALDLGWYVSSVNASRVRIVRGGATAGQFVQVQARVFN